MSDTHSTPQSQPTDLVRRFEPARAARAPRCCDRSAGCWVITGKILKAGGNPNHCAACDGEPVFPGETDALHTAALRRCMAAQP